MASARVSGFRRQQAALCLAGVLLLAGLLAALLITGGVPAAHADGPTMTLSTSTTNPNGEVLITGSGWSPAKHYNLYVYAQRLCNNAPTCPPPAGKTPVNSTPFAIKSNGTWSFDFTFSKSAAAITYVLTAVADYPADTPFTASVPIQVVPAGTPPSGTPVSSSPTAPPASASPTKVPASPTTTSQANTTPGNQNTTTPTSASGGNTLAIVVVVVLLLIAIAVLIGLLIVLPPKRRAIRAAWYGAGASAGRRYGGSGPAAPGGRRGSGGYPPVGNQEPPAWTGGVSQWDDAPRPPRGSRPMPPQPPRRPPGRDYRE